MATTNTINAAETIEATGKLETEPCTRCGGSGNYSYCPRYGTTCFRCAGRKVTYTKRGAIAAKYLNDLLSKPIGEIKAGDSIRGLGISAEGELYGQWEKVVSVRPEDGSGGCSIVNGERVAWTGFIVQTTKCTYHAIAADRKFRVAATPEVKAEALARAVAYQATLTKAGTVRKR